MAKVWEQISPPIFRDGNTTTWTPSTGSTHYVLIDEGMDPPDDADFIVALTPGKQDRFRIKGELTGSGTITRIRVGFRYSGEALPTVPGIDIRLWAGGVRWGSTAEFKLATDGEAYNVQAIFNIEPGRTVDDWNDAGTRLIWFTSVAAEPNYVAPPEYQPQAE